MADQQPNFSVMIWGAKPVKSVKYHFIFMTIEFIFMIFHLIFMMIELIFMIFHLIFNMIDLIFMMIELIFMVFHLIFMMIGWSNFYGLSFYFYGDWVI